MTPEKVWIGRVEEKVGLEIQGHEFTLTVPEAKELVTILQDVLAKTRTENE